MATVDFYIQQLASFGYRPNWKLFEPTDSFYSWLLSGEDSDLYEAAKVLADDIEIPPLRLVSYEWGLIMPTSVAGRIHIHPATESRIHGKEIESVSLFHPVPP